MNDILEIRVIITVTIIECPLCGSIYYIGDQCIDGSNEVYSCTCGFTDAIGAWPYDIDEIPVLLTLGGNSIDYIVQRGD